MHLCTNITQLELAMAVLLNTTNQTKKTMSSIKYFIHADASTSRHSDQLLGKAWHALLIRLCNQKTSWKPILDLGTGQEVVALQRFLIHMCAESGAIEKVCM